MTKYLICKLARQIITDFTMQIAAPVMPANQFFFAFKPNIISTLHKKLLPFMSLQSFISAIEDWTRQYKLYIIANLIQYTLCEEGFININLHQRNTLHRRILITSLIRCLQGMY